jgi:hypothetical protein
MRPQHLRQAAFGLMLGAWLALAGPAAQAQEFLGWAYDGELMLDAQETQDVTASAAVFTKRIGRISFDTGKLCTRCGNFSDLQGMGVSHVEKRLNSDFVAFLRKQFQRSGLFPDEVRERISLAATMTALEQTSSVGADAERESRMSSGAVLTTKVSIRYEMFDQAESVGTWEVTTVARSNSNAASTRLAEAIDGALKRNVRGVLLKILSDYSTADAARAQRALAALHVETDNTRSVLGYLVVGAGKTAGAVGDGLVAVAKNGDVIAATLNAKAGEMKRVEAASRGSSVEEDEAKARRDTEFYARVAAQQEDPNSELNRDKRAREKQQADAKQADADRAAKSAARKADTDDRRADATARRDADDAAARKKEEAAALKEKQAQDEKRQADERRAQELRDSIERKRVADAKEAERKAEKEREARAEADRRSDYLASLRTTIRLAAISCPGGEGKHYIVGVRPRIKPEVVSCIDVQYTEFCPGQTNGTPGVAKNFVGAGTDCYFGDTATVSPTPSCKAKTARVVVEAVRVCE